MNNLPPIKIGLRIPDHPDDIQGYIFQVLGELGKHITLTEELERKVKLILIELITNSIKHSTDPEALLQLTITHPRLTIEKIDVGLQIIFEGAEQIPFKEIDKTMQVSFSNNNSHDIKVTDHYKFRFLDKYKDNMSIDHFPENFGFFIITVASDSFEYEHDPESKKNTFIVQINL
ncbi:anti-sigma regulatory factor (Ser/Thr protein kinase) [Pedobacter sp. CAN_A7]|uniref:hypothetical protein n=1 Tax=Pedobacter sp. CAN_A7 TaxID=2787722 RepID=UPI0018C8D988